MFLSRLLLSKFTSFVIISLNIIAFSHGANEEGNPHYHVLHMDQLRSKPICSAHNKTGMGSHKMKLSRMYGPCSPLANSVRVPSSDEILAKNEARVQSLNSHFKSASSKIGVRGKSIQPSPSKGLGAQYHITIGLGTPKVDYKVIIDTGSDSTWVRCKPCKKGCNGTLFDPQKSSTYTSGSERFCQNYSDKSYAVGSWINDTLTLEPSQVLNKFKFGCATDINADPDDFADVAGVLGLGRGRDSLVSQSPYGKNFLYCFPKSKDADAYLHFGDEARNIASSSTPQYTQLLRKPDSFYHLQLVGISVARRRLTVASSVFTSVGTIIDSGTVVTHLPKQAYDALSSAFSQSMSAYQRASPEEVLDTCFIVKSGGSFVIPSVTFHFADGDVALDESGIGLFSENNNTWCLGFTTNDNDLTIIGNTQQRGMVVVYDLEAGKIGFGKKNCGN